MTLDCGHPDQPHATGTGHGLTAAGATLCYPCADDSTRAMIAAGSAVVLYDTGDPDLTTWTGGAMLRVTDRGTFRYNMGGRMTTLRAVDPTGRYWHGRHSADWCQCVTMRRGTAGR